MWYSHRVMSRRKLCIQAKSRATFQRFRYRRSLRSSWLLFRWAPVGRDHLDAVFLLEPSVERIRVVGLVADEPCGEFVEEASGQNVFHKLAFGPQRKRHIWATGEDIVLPSCDQFPSSPRR